MVVHFHRFPMESCAHRKQVDLGTLEPRPEEGESGEGGGGGLAWDS